MRLQVLSAAGNAPIGRRRLVAKKAFKSKLWCRCGEAEGLGDPDSAVAASLKA